jgi:hypothetical protein
MDFVASFWHCECICHISKKAYRPVCRELWAITTLPKNDNTKLLITTAAQELITAKATRAVMRAEMLRLARQLPEYAVLAMYGVDEITAAQLGAEIGDVRRFPHRSALAGFSGVDPAVNQFLRIGSFFILRLDFYCYSPGTHTFFLSIYLPHLPRMIPCSYWASI